MTFLASMSMLLSILGGIAFFVICLVLIVFFLDAAGRI